MTLPSSGPISLSDLNGEFGNAGADQLSFSQAFGGTYAQYGAINRNTTAGQNIYGVNDGGIEFFLSTFYSYNDLENNYWEYNFDATGYDYDSIVRVYIASTNIYENTVFSNSSDASGAYVDTTTSATTGGDLSLQLECGPPNPSSVDILVTDPDTTATIYSALGVNPRDYGSETVLATIYGYQRLNFSIIFYN
jgi:hypothetical protein